LKKKTRNFDEKFKFQSLPRFIFYIKNSKFWPKGRNFELCRKYQDKDNRPPELGQFFHHIFSPDANLPIRVFQPWLDLAKHLWKLSDFRRKFRIGNRRLKWFLRRNMTQQVQVWVVKMAYPCYAKIMKKFVIFNQIIPKFEISKKKHYILRLSRNFVNFDFCFQCWDFQEIFIFFNFEIFKKFSFFSNFEIFKKFTFFFNFEIFKKFSFFSILRFSRNFHFFQFWDFQEIFFNFQGYDRIPNFTTLVQVTHNQPQAQERAYFLRFPFDGQPLTNGIGENFRKQNIRNWPFFRKEHIFYANIFQAEIFYARNIFYAKISLRKKLA